MWAPGQSGNPNGARKPRIIAQQLISSLNEAAAGTDKTKLRLLVDRLIERAIVDGDVAAIREIVDRVDGKVPQAIEGSLEAPLTIELIRRVIVDGSRVLIDATADDVSGVEDVAAS